MTDPNLDPETDDPDDDLTPGSCPKCGQEHDLTRCSAHKKLKDEDGNTIGLRQCRRRPTIGLSVCNSHGGANAISQQKAARVKAEREVAAAARTYGAPRKVDPATFMLEEVYRTAGVVAYLESKVGALPEESVVWNVVEQSEHDGGPQAGTAEIARMQTHAYVELLMKERKHGFDAAAKCISLGLQERVVRSAETQGRQWFAVLQMSFDLLELTARQRKMVPDVMQAVMTKVASLAVGVQPVAVGAS